MVSAVSSMECSHERPTRCRSPNEVRDEDQETAPDSPRRRPLGLRHRPHRHEQLRARGGRLHRQLPADAGPVQALGRGHGGVELHGPVHELQRLLHRRHVEQRELRHLRYDLRERVDLHGGQVHDAHELVQPAPAERRPGRHGRREVRGRGRAAGDHPLEHPRRGDRRSGEHDQWLHVADVQRRSAAHAPFREGVLWAGAKLLCQLRQGRRQLEHLRAAHLLSGLQVAGRRRIPLREQGEVGVGYARQACDEPGHPRVGWRKTLKMPRPSSRSCRGFSVTIIFFTDLPAHLLQAVKPQDKQPKDGYFLYHLATSDYIRRDFHSTVLWNY